MPEPLTGAEQLAARVSDADAEGLGARLEAAAGGEDRLDMFLAVVARRLAPRLARQYKDDLTFAGLLKGILLCGAWLSEQEPPDA